MCVLSTVYTLYIYIGKIIRLYVLYTVLQYLLYIHYIYIGKIIRLYVYSTVQQPHYFAFVK